MDHIDIRVFINNNDKVKEINADNEWLAALLSGEAAKATKRKKRQPEQHAQSRMVSSTQLRAIRQVT